jgi:CheY-like chemotaxis protein
MLAEMWWILIAEDEVEVREMFRNAILKKLDSIGRLAHVVEANDGAEAISKVSARAFDCIVTDLRMPRTTGESMIRAIQTQPLNFNTPIIVISAHAREEFQNFCVEYEHIRYLDKPCTPDQVAEAAIKELNYGKRDSRISVHLLNPFLKAAKAQFPSVIGDLASNHKTSLKKGGTEMAGDVQCILSLRSEFSKAHFCIGFDKSLLQDETPSTEAREEFVRPKEQPHRLTNRSRELAFEMIESAMPHLKICLGGSPRLKGMTQVLKSRQDDPNQGLLKNATGVTMTIETPKGRIYLSALCAQDFTVFKKLGAA